MHQLITFNFLKDKMADITRLIILIELLPAALIFLGKMSADQRQDEIIKTKGVKYGCVTGEKLAF